MSVGEHKTDAATYDELDVRVVAGSDRQLHLPVEGGWRKFPVPGDISIPTMAKLFLVEKRIDAAESAEDLEGAFDEAIREITRLVRTRTPDAPEIDRDEFGVKRITAALAWLAGDASVANAIAVTLMAGAPLDTEKKGVATAHAASGEDTADVHGEDPGPLGSSEPSSTRSSHSDGSTDGDRSGGAESPGERSGSTSQTPEPAAAT